MLNCLGADWRPTIGDPTVFGWLTVLAYLICAILSAMVWHSRPEPVLRRFWAFSALLLAFLAINKQLDLQTAMTGTLRCMSLEQGWYEVRRFAKLAFILVMAAVVVLLYVRGVRMMRGYASSHRLAMIGLGFVALYVLIRATSFHWIDFLSSLPVGGVSMNVLLETFGLLLIAINAIGLLTGRIRVAEVHDVEPQRETVANAFPTSPPTARADPFTAPSTARTPTSTRPDSADRPATTSRSFPVDPHDR